jgi:hypothetical protein
LAIIGAGPSGFYAASRLLSLLPADSPEGAKVQVDMYERLPTPYGLARYGVAPDHPEVKVSQMVATYYTGCLDTGVLSDQITDKVHFCRIASTSLMNCQQTRDSDTSAIHQ